MNQVFIIILCSFVSFAFFFMFANTFVSALYNKAEKQKSRFKNIQYVWFLIENIVTILLILV